MVCIGPVCELEEQEEDLLIGRHRVKDIEEAKALRNANQTRGQHFAVQMGGTGLGLT